MSSPSVLHGRRLNHWALSVRPLHGPPGLLWLSADDKLLGLDPVSGARRIEQPLKPASGDRYAVATDRWPQRVREVGAPPSLGATLVDGAVRVARGDEEVARVSVPTGFGSTSHLKVDDDVAWLFHEPSRGAVKMRIARLDLESR
ncbi:MAG: hypothetical protein H6719_33985, partial [Sandaracinaceae bacterium]|nr:hypothetical protein [Sandaracinaceae bacterium]